MEKSDYIFGIRAVIEAIESGKELDKILIKKDLNGELAQELFHKIKEYGILTQRVPIEKLNRITMKNHQGVVAILSPISYYTIIPHKKQYKEASAFAESSSVLLSYWREF